MTDRSVETARRLIVLGSTGSIGRSTLEVVDHLRSACGIDFDVIGLAAGTGAAPLMAQAARHGATHVALATPDPEIVPPPGVTLHAGADAAEALVRAAARPGDLVVAAIVGAAGLPAVLAAIDAGCDVALANKETLVAAGAIVMPRVRAAGVRLLPIDSEHSAIFQCLPAEGERAAIRRIVLTASGGPFRTWTKDRIDGATLDEALDHPTWRMGVKNTIDSASLMNKALELIEAHWLFDLPADRIEAIVHPQSVVHGLVEFTDGSVLAQLSPPDMRTPIQVALTWPRRLDGCAATLDWTNLGSFDFEPVDAERFPAPALAAGVIRAGGISGAVFNAANEVAVGAFVAGRIGFGRIIEIVRDALKAMPAAPVRGLEDVLRADAATRALVLGQMLDDAVPPGTAESGASAAYQ